MSDTPAPRYTRSKRDGPLSFTTKLYQGIGAIPDVVKNWSFNTFALLYYNQILGVDAVLVSIALALALAFDAVSDPVVASISDNAKSRWGRRHPLMLLSSVPLGAALFAVFTPPGGLSSEGLFAWLLFFTLLTRGLMTLYFVPWAAIAAELSDDYHERTSVMAYRYAVGWTVGVGLPLYIFTAVMPGTAEFPVGQLNPAGYPQMAFIVACLMSGGALATTLLTWREIPYLRQHVGQPSRFSVARLVLEVRQALQNRQFALVFIIVLMSSGIAGITANLGIYMTTFFWGFTTEDLRWFTLSAVGAVLAFPLVGGVQRRWEKKRILLVCYSVSVADGIFLVSLRLLDVLPQNGDPMLLVILVAMGVLAVSLAVIQGIISASIVADLLDDQELRTGIRQEAMFSAALSFSGKAVSGIGTVLGGLIITLIDFPTGAVPAAVPANALLKLGVVVGIVVPLLYLMPIRLLTRYTITRERHSEIVQALTARHKGGSA